ncbi:MAG TPA: 4-(cytidine 5'-diphospho)-2-C-methyl-D-erythritol kinase [Vicinamibacteria bacterium]|nr:4-(cytidine 5'-diphospho)-2-C-methyl-D-erythritol kinase [Vicinamibacteria bacterium]
MKSRVLRVRSYAKINLGLEVLGVRADGYHELRTLFQSVDLHDDLILRLTPDGRVSLRCDHSGVPTDESNLAVRAARAILGFAKRNEGVEIVLKKRIPVAGGLGGGSSNAAATLMALDRGLRLGLGASNLLLLARRLGADVPYFLVGGTALGLARGDEVFALARQLRAHVVIVDPERPVSTAAVFRRVAARLTPRENSRSIYYFGSSDLEGDAGFRALVNELEDAALEEAPDLRAAVSRVRGVLSEAGARHMALSGSGSTYFGLFRDARRAQKAVAALRALGFRALRCRTLTLDQYRKGVQRG